jgi:hypothetical protein
LESNLKSTYYIKQREQLLEDIVYDLKKIVASNSLVPISCLNIELYEYGIEEPILVGSFDSVMEYIVDDIYWDGENDWSNAYKADVKVI